MLRWRPIAEQSIPQLYSLDYPTAAQSFTSPPPNYRLKNNAGGCEVWGLREVELLTRSITEPIEVSPEIPQELLVALLLLRLRPTGSTSIPVGPQREITARRVPSARRRG